MIANKMIVISALLLGAGFWAIGCENSGKSDTKTDVHQSAHMNHTGHNHDAMNSEKGSSRIAQKTCPVMGNPINKDLFVDYSGKRIYVCCGMCVDQVKKDPEKYLKKLTEMGEQPANIQ